MTIFEVFLGCIQGQHGNWWWLWENKHIVGIYRLYLGYPEWDMNVDWISAKLSYIFKLNCNSINYLFCISDLNCHCILAFGNLCGSHTQYALRNNQLHLRQTCWNTSFINSIAMPGYIWFEIYLYLDIKSPDPQLVLSWLDNSLMIAQNISVIACIMVTIQALKLGN